MRLKVSILFLLIILVFVQCNAPSDVDSNSSKNDKCICDSTKVEQAILKEDFNKMDPYDKSTFKPDSLYSLSKDENKLLWYRDIENPDTTKFTKRWNDYLITNYHANHFDFVKYYENKPNIDIAFQFGPNRDLWAYHIFVVKKIEGCYLITRSYFRHARFTYKAYAIIDKLQLDTLFDILQPIQKQPLDSGESWNYRGYFADNRNNKQFYIELETQDTLTKEHKKYIGDLFDFVDNKINWKVTYQ